MHIRKNVRERQVLAEYEKAGYQIITKGWPDFLVDAGDKIFAVEIKRKQKRPSAKMGLSSHQRKCHALLRRLGMEVIVKYIE